MRLACAALLMLSASAFALPALTDAEAQQAHANGLCGSLGPGTGLSPDGSGWIVSMLPGPHEFRMMLGGSVGVTVRKYQKLDFDAGRPYQIAVDGPVSHLQWKAPGHDWGPVSTLFLYPSTKAVPR